MTGFMEGLPGPEADTIDHFFWESARRHELCIQTCQHCGKMRHPPRLVCPHCQSTGCIWTRVSGRGELYSFTVVHHPAHPALVGHPPYAVILVSLEEDPEIRFLSNLIEAESSGIVVGMPVEVVWEERPEGTVLPRFKKREK